MVNEEEVKFIFQIHPCTEDGLVTIEAKLYLGSPFGRPGEDFLDTRQMCAALRRLWFLDSLRCSEEMGYALAEWEGKRIHVFKGGKIIIRRAKDEDDARRTLRCFGRALWATIPCSCGRSLVYCASGACDECSGRVCETHAYPPFAESQESTSHIRGGEILHSLEKIKAKDHLVGAFRGLESYVSILREMDERIMKKDYSGFESLVKRAEDVMEDACHEGMKFITQTSKDNEAGLGIIFLGMAEDLSKVMEAMRLAEGAVDLEEYPEAQDIAFDAFDAFMRDDIDAASRIEKRFKEFMRKKHSKPSVVIARSGHHIARMITKPYPA